jgi:hypothetical protein
MNDELGDRIVYSPRGRQAEDDLAECMVRAAHIFWMGGQLVWITDGRRVPVVRDVVIELCRRFVVTAHPINRGTEAEPNWVIEYRPVVPTELTVRNLIRESLPKRVPMVQPEVAPTAPEPMLPVVHDPKTLAEIAAGQRRSAQFQT